MLACARLGAIHSVVFGGFAAPRARHPHRRRPPQGRGVRVLRHRGRAVVEYKPLLDRALELAAHERARALRRAAAAAGRGRRWSRAATSTGPTPSRRPSRRRCVARSRPPTRSTCSTPRAPPASPRAWCATTAATPSRCAGRCRTSTASQPGEVVLGRLRRRLGRRATPTSSTRRCCRAAPPCSTRASRSARRTPGAFWRVVAEHGVRSAVHRADRVPRDQEGGPAGRASRRPRPLGPASAVPRRRARRPRHLRLGRRAARHPGDRPLVADRDRLADGRQLPRHRAAAGQARLPTRPVPGYGVEVLDADGQPSRAPAATARSS